VGRPCGQIPLLGDGQVNFSGIFSYEAKVIELLLGSSYFPAQNIHDHATG
jgi:hypothetical protein